MPRAHTNAACALIAGEKADKTDISHLCVYLSKELESEKDLEFWGRSTSLSFTYPSLAGDDHRWVEDSPLTKAFRVLPLTAEKRMLDEPSVVESDSSGMTMRRSHVRRLLSGKRDILYNGSEAAIAQQSGISVFDYRAGFTFKSQDLSKDILQASLTARDIDGMLDDVAEMTSHCWTKGRMVVDCPDELSTTVRFFWPLSQRELKIPGSEGTVKENSVKVDVCAEISATYSKNPPTESTKAEDKD